ncbi:MAG: sulfatase-like hydrolase/transferase, partial [Verrucomicrobiota bacterium]
VAEDFIFADVSPRFTREAIKIIESHSDSSRPLFLFLAYPSPHTPWLPSADFEGKSGAGMYGDFVAELDHMIGQVLDSLEQTGMGKDTLVIFTSDNGPVWYEANSEKFGHRATGNLRGIKASVWEGGHRVPLIIKWPDHAPEKSQSDDLIIFTDFVKTFAELTEQDPENYSTAVDGVSILRSILNPGTLNSRSPIIHSKGRAIRDGRWKYIEAKAKRGFSASKGDEFGDELYNMENDPSETQNLAARYPEKVARLKKELIKLRGFD